MKTTTNRTFWSTKGGALAFQPGWFQGHKDAFIYANLGFGTDGPDNGPPNMSFPMITPFQIQGPSNNPYPGTICLPQVPLPKNSSVKAGDNATIQVVELAAHGASLFSVRHCLPTYFLSSRTFISPTPKQISFSPCLYSYKSKTGKAILTFVTSPPQCVDITFAEPGDPRIAQVNESTCFNSSEIGFAEIYTIANSVAGPGNATSGAGGRFLYRGQPGPLGLLAQLGWAPVLVAGLLILL